MRMFFLLCSNVRYLPMEMTCVAIIVMTAGKYEKYPLNMQYQELPPLKGHCHGGKTWKNQAGFFKFGSWFPGGMTIMKPFF